MRVFCPPPSFICQMDPEEDLPDEDLSGREGFGAAGLASAAAGAGTFLLA